MDGQNVKCLHRKYSCFRLGFVFIIKNDYTIPVTEGVVSCPRVVVDVIRGIGIVRITPALVPTHSKSLHTNRAVIRKHAALC